MRRLPGAADLQRRVRRFSGLGRRSGEAWSEAGMKRLRNWLCRHLCRDVFEQQAWVIDLLNATIRRLEDELEARREKGASKGASK